jgi:hypothetical protein
MFGDNNFGSDNYSGRSFRLNKLSDSIRDYAVGLEIPAELLNWAENSYNGFNTVESNLDDKRNILRHEKHELADADKKLQISYQVCKNILQSRFRDDDRLAMFGIEGATPKQHIALASSAGIMLRAVADMQAEGMTDVLLEQFRLPLEENLAAAAEYYYKIGVLEEKLAKARRQCEEHFEQDTRNLRILYNFIIGYRGRNSPDLPMIGFAIDNKKRGRKRIKKEKPEIEEIK